MSNYHDFPDVLAFLGSGKVVITNSYHGLYWATLLSKKVLCLDAGGKFAHFKWPPTHVKPEAVEEALAHANSIPEYPDALAECRSLNLAFYQKVLTILGDQAGGPA